MSSLWLAAFLAGLSGGVHCVAMCGPLAMGGGRGWQFGRLTAYLAAGALAGAGTRLLPTGPLPALLAALTLTWACLRHAGLVPQARVATPAWTNPLLRLRSRIPRALWGFLLGITAALLPCGLFWGALALALAARSAVGGVGVLLAFYLGTLPLMLLAPAALRRLSSGARRGLTLAVLVLGLVAIAHRALHAPGADGEVCGAPPATG